MKTNSSYASVLAASVIANSASSAENLRIYFGTQAKNEQRGIYMSLFNTQTGQLSTAEKVCDSVRPGFIAIHPDGKHIYATEATGSFSGGKTGFVSAYRIEKPSGNLTDLNTQPSGGSGPCHVSIDPTGKWLLAANYRGGSCSILPILGNGELGEPVSIRQHEGSGPHPRRQEKAHTHSFNCDPSGRFALSADLGMDKILVYELNDGELTLRSQTATAPGAGPRHLTFSPCGKFVYACMELNGTVCVYEINEGTLAEIQVLPTLPADFDGPNTTSEICLTPDGHFLYVGNRGHESLAIYAVNSQQGTLTALGHEPTRGRHPRHFNIDPTGHWLICANAHTDNVVVFAIDPQTGQLKFNGSEIAVPAATCIQFHGQ